MRISISCGSDDLIRISLHDNASGIEFVSARMDCEDFAKAVTGLAYVPISGDVRGVEYLGKTHVSEPRTIFCPLKTHRKDALVEWLKNNAQEDGWILDTYLNSQNSVISDGKGCRLNYRVHKYIEKE